MSDSEKHLQVMELFGPTIQGEGLMTGTITHFLRVGGCSLRCSWCDSLFSVLPEEIKKHRRLMTTAEILQDIREMPSAPYITFTGGDPAIQDRLGDIIPALNTMGMRVAVETQGMFFPDWFKNADVLTFSPKGPSSGNIVQVPPLAGYLIGLSARRSMRVCVKVVVFNEADFKYGMSVYRALPEWSYDAFYFTAGTPPFEDQQPAQFRALDVIHNQQVLATLLLKEAAGMDVEFNHKVHLGCQQHVLLWPTQEKGV